MKSSKAVALIVFLSMLTFSVSINASYAGPQTLRADSTSTYHQVINAGQYFYLSAYRSQGTGLFGNFSVTAGGNKDINFFIFDSSNYQKWTGGQSASAYLPQSKVTTYSWTFNVPYSGTWYIVFDNSFSLITSKTVDILTGVDGTGPEITISHPYSGDTIAGTVAIDASAVDNHFSVYSMTIEIDGTSVKTEYSGSISYSWDSTSTSNGQHTITVTASDEVGNSNSKSIIVSVSNALGGVFPTSPVGLLELGLIIVIVVALIAVVVSKSRKGKGAELVEPVSKPVRRVSRPVEVTSKPVEQEAPKTGTAFCSNCGAKITPGATFCKNCGANLEG